MYKKNTNVTWYDSCVQFSHSTAYHFKRFGPLICITFKGFAMSL